MGKVLDPGGKEGFLLTPVPERYLTHSWHKVSNIYVPETRFPVFDHIFAILHGKAFLRFAIVGDMAFVRWVNRNREPSAVVSFTACIYGRIFNMPFIVSENRLIQVSDLMRLRTEFVLPSSFKPLRRVLFE